MDDRSEPRFRTEAPASLKVVRRDNVCEFKCSIVDISGVGFRLTMHESLQAGETIRLEISQDQALNHVIAVVRHCKSTEDQFSIGVERVDDWLVTRAIVEPEAVSSPAVSKLATLPVETPEGEPVRVIGRAKVKHLNSLTKVATQQLFVTMQERAKRRAKRKQASKKVLTVAGAAFGLALVGLFFVRIPPKLRGGSLPQVSAALNCTRPLPKSQPNGSSQSNETNQSNGMNQANGTDLSQKQPDAPRQPAAPLTSATEQQPQAIPVVTARTIATNPSVAPQARPAFSRSSTRFW